MRTQSKGNEINDVLKRADDVQELEETEIKLQRAMLETLSNIRLLVQMYRNLGLSDEEIKDVAPAELYQLPEKAIEYIFG